MIISSGFMFRFLFKNKAFHSSRSNEIYASLLLSRYGNAATSSSKKFMQTTKEPNKGKIRGANPINSAAFKIVEEIFQVLFCFRHIIQWVWRTQKSGPNGPLNF